MKVLITGGLGFVGTQLSIRFLASGHEVTVVDHAPRPKPYTPAGVRYVSADTTVAGPWQEEIANRDVIINLAGASIFGRWSAAWNTVIVYEGKPAILGNVLDVTALKKAESASKAYAQELERSNKELHRTLRSSLHTTFRNLFERSGPSVISSNRSARTLWMKRPRTSSIACRMQAPG